MASRIVRVVRLRWRALRLGVPFIRYSRLRWRGTISVGGASRELHLPPDDRAAPWILGEVLLRDVYGLIPRRGRYSTILDVGANIGAFSLAARRTNPDAVIHAYEPNAELEPYLAGNCAAAGAQYHLEALARDFEGRALRSRNDSAAQTQTVPGEGVPSVTLRAALDRIGGSVDLLKLDCEGAEWELLEDDRPWHDVRELVMEYHLEPGRTLPELESAIRLLGFSVEQSEPINGYIGIVRARRTTDT